MNTKIDAHQHFWHYNAAEYPWISAGMDALRHDFLPADLKLQMDQAGVSRAISVQARQDLAETEWLLQLAGKNAFLAGVVGWVPLTSANVGATLEHLAANRKLKGIRHVLEGEEDPRYMLRPDFNSGISLLNRFQLSYDILISERHLPQTIQFVDLHPDQVFVLDHLAKPRVREKVLSPWKENVAELAKRQNVFCKLSGLATEGDWKAWRPESFRPYIDAILEAFTPKRILFGSDWPVLLLAGSYAKWVEAVEAEIAGLSADERQQIWSETATKVYRL